MSKGDNTRPRSSHISKEEYDRNFEAIFGVRELKTWKPGEDDEPNADVQGSGVDVEVGQDTRGGEEERGN